jgi:predicted protein tyrosine phosphatase
MQHLRTAPRACSTAIRCWRRISRPDQILLTTAAAPDLAVALDRMADVNPTYRSLRDARWRAG